MKDTTGYGIVWDYFGNSLGYGLFTSYNFKNWTRITNEKYPYYNDKVKFPSGIRHGCILGITNKELIELKKNFGVK